ncbi:zinc-ribbon domain-containing protein [Lactiplantibacillus plantarum]|uniref:zinc-ribbon domain-containing protein n=1 Tax=Lactiplantibacillus plantarum TaxID=1590 RepID=UPI0021CB69B6|nr:zinc-ribbon domain-containing protein [Lactiplantibacillus plantarum]
MKICPNCQHENEADNVFCENCGADLTHIDSAERTQASGTEQKLGIQGNIKLINQLRRSNQGGCESVEACSQSSLLWEVDLGLSISHW